MTSSRREILDDFLSYVNAAGDAAKRDQAERLLNRVIECIWLKRGWRQFLVPTLYEFSTVANTRSYALPDYFGRISSANRVIRNLTEGRQIHPTDRSDLEADDPQIGTSLEASGCPTRYEIAGTTPVQTQPATAGEALEVLSSSASDTAVRVHVEGLNASGVLTQTQVTLTGTTAVALGAWSLIHQFGKSYPFGTAPTTELTTSEGTVTLRKVTGGTTLQTLAPWQSSREHQTIVLYLVPDKVYVIGVPILRAPQRIYQDADPLPPFWTNAIFEKMVLAWRVADQNVNADGAETWPALVDLICWDNAQTAQAFQRRRPYGG